MKKSLAVMLALIMVLCMIPTTALAASNSTVVLHPSVNHTVTGVKVKVGDKIDGHSITKISGYDITVDLGKYNVNNDTFRLPYAKDIWEGVDNNKVDYISWAGSGSNKRSEGASALLANGKNTAYYYFKGAPTYKTFTLKYDANGGTGAPATQTYTATSQYENSHTFTISNDEPTRQDYEFKGWAERPNDTAATRQPGGSIVVTGTTTLYAVWGNHEHKDENGDGYCDTDQECMHKKDQDGYCIVDGCTHPHEGDGACCPKKPDNKPEPPKPENTPGIPGLTDVDKVVKVKCETAPKSHKEQTFGFNWSSYEADEPTLRGNDWFCTITVLPGGYVTAYNTYPYYSGHTLDPDGQKDTLTLKWNSTANQWENTESNKLPITFTVKCDTVESTVPDKPGEGVILDLINKINVQCIANTDPKHPEKDYDPIAGSYTVGEVEGNPRSGYTCTVTIVPDKYVEKYNADVTGTKHTLAAGEGNKTVTLKYDSTNDEWKVATGMPVVFKVKCETVPEETYYIVTYTDGVGGAAFVDQAIRVKSGEPTPPFTGTPSRSGYTFTGWTPAVTDTVTGNVTYTAQWKNNDNHTPGGGNGGGGHYHPTTPVPVIVIPPKTGDMTIWQSILHFFGII